MSKVGDKVFYVPHECHAKDKCADGSYAYKFMGVDPNDSTKRKDLTDAEVFTFISNLRRRPDLARCLIAKKPQCVWEAVITSLSGDCADLDIKGPQPGVTFGYSNLPYDPTGTLPHTWHTLADAQGVVNEASVVPDTDPE